MRNGLLLLLFTVVGITIAGMSVRPFPEPSVNVDEIVEYHPFSPWFPLNPAQVFSVGDQVLCERIFGYHARSSLSDGLKPVLSSFTFNREKNTVSIVPNAVKRSDGSAYTAEHTCAALKNTFQTGYHTPYWKLIKNISCKDTEVLVEFTKIPANLNWLLTVPDFSMYDVDSIPLKSNSQVATTGPYQLVSFDEKSRETLLRLNPHYPVKMRSNSIERLRLRRYPPGGTGALIETLNPNLDHLVYFFGKDITEGRLQTLKEKKYRIQIFPSEWVIYIGFDPKVVPLEDRIALASELDTIRKPLAEDTPFSQPAFSFCPSDRPHCLSEDLYNEATGEDKKKMKLTRPYSISTYSFWAKNPMFKRVINHLQSKFTKLKVHTIGLEEQADLLREPFYISMAGMSPSDPLSHYSYQLSASNSLHSIITKDDLARYAALKTSGEMKVRVRSLEVEIAKKRLLVPLIHFSGIVAESPLFEKDHSRSWSWGIQPWLYKVANH